MVRDKSETRERINDQLEKIRGKRGVTKDNFERRSKEVEENVDLLRLQLETLSDDIETASERHSDLKKRYDTDGGHVKKELYEALLEGNKAYDKYVTWLGLGFNLVTTFMEELLDVCRELKKLENKEAVLEESQRLVQKLSNIHEKNMEATHESFSKELRNIVEIQAENLKHIHSKVLRKHDEINQKLDELNTEKKGFVSNQKKVREKATTSGRNEEDNDVKPKNDVESNVPEKDVDLNKIKNDEDEEDSATRQVIQSIRSKQKKEQGEEGGTS